MESATKRGTRHLRGNSTRVQKKTNAEQTLFGSEVAKTQDKFLGFDDREVLNSTKKILVRNAKKNRIDTVTRKQGIDSNHSVSFASPPPQEVPSFELSEFDENLETEQESFSVCITSLVDSIHVDDNSGAPNKLCESEVTSTGKGHLPPRSSFLREIVLGEKNTELSSEISKDDGDDESVVYDSTGEESDEEVIEPIVTPIRQHKRKSVELPDDEIEYNFPPKRRKTLNSTSGISEYTDKPLPDDKNVEEVQSPKPLAKETLNSTVDLESPTDNNKSTKAVENKAEQEAVQLSESLTNGQKSFTSNCADADTFDFSEWDEPFQITIQERVKLRVRKTLRNVEKTITKNTMDTKFTSQKSQNARKTQSTSTLESTPKSKTRVAKAKRHHSLEMDTKSKVTASTRNTKHCNAQRSRLASTPVRPLKCTLIRIDEAQLRELSPRTLSPISSPSQAPLKSSARRFQSREVSSEKKSRRQPHTTLRSTPARRRLSGNIKTRNSSQ